MKTCIACGMPMQKPADFAGGDVTKNYCVYCARPDGTMQSFAEKRAGMIRFLQETQGVKETVAAEIAEASMRKLPAWQAHFTKGATDGSAE